MKRIISLILALCLVLCLAACGGAAETGKYVAGEYEGSAAGLYSIIKVKVTVSANAIESVEVVEHGETEGYGTPAIEQLPAKIVEAQSTEVDVITGATFASNGLIEAVNKALAKAMPQ